MPEQIVTINVYAKVLAALLVLTATTCAVSFIDMGRMNAVVAVVIAFAKASLVALIFMHMRYKPPFDVNRGGGGAVLAGHINCVNYGRLPDARLAITPQR